MKLKDKITQGMLEDYEAGVRAAGQDLPIAKARGEIARIAVACGWIDGVDLDDPQQVRELADLAAAKYLELLNISPQSIGGGEARPESEQPSAA